MLRYGYLEVLQRVPGLRDNESRLYTQTFFSCQSCPKISTSLFYHLQMRPMNAGCEGNSVDAVQKPHSAASELSLHCLLRSLCLNT